MTPGCLFANINAETHDFVLMMDDLFPADQADQTQGLALSQVELALDQAARLHASYWNDERLDDNTWMWETRAAGATATPELILGLWTQFLDRYGARINPACRRVGEAITANFVAFRFGYDGPKCLTHNDFRPDNMMFGTAQGGAPVTIVDWQTPGYGCPMADVSYFLGGALSVESRRANEKALLEGYLKPLRAARVTDYGWDRLWRDYARYSFALFNIAFTAAMVVEQTPRGDDMFFAMLEGGAAHVLDLGAIAVLHKP